MNNKFKDDYVQVINCTKCNCQATLIQSSKGYRVACLNNECDCKTSQDYVSTPTEALQNWNERFNTSNIC